MAFVPEKQTTKNDFEDYIILNGTTVAVGDPVYMAGSAGSGEFVSRAMSLSTTIKVYGVVMGFKSTNSTSNIGDLTVNSVVAAANNQTSAQVRAIVLPVRGYRRFIADLSTSVETTSGSSDPGWFSLNGGLGTSATLSESSYTVQTNTVQGQFYSLGARPGTQGTATQVIGYFNFVI